MKPRPVCSFALLRGNTALWWREQCESGHRPATWEQFCVEMRAQFRPENYSHRGRDELVLLHQYKNESVADFVFCFRATYLKIEDLATAEKLDLFVSVLVPEVRLQVELLGSREFTKVAMFAECANAVITHVSGQDTHKTMAKTGKKWVPAASTATDKKYCRNQCTWHTRSGTHEVGDGKEVDVVKVRVPKAAE